MEVWLIPTILVQFVETLPQNGPVGVKLAGNGIVSQKISVYHKGRRKAAWANPGEATYR
tara:strand:- start:12 stop:188 length:177 start_codon:yes stop_codon:yes gene_type:complete